MNTWYAEPTSLADVELIRFYNEGLLRQPDRGGWEYWQARLCPRASMQYAARAILGSSEMVTTINASEYEIRQGGLWKERAIRRVYRAMLNRNPDAGGLKYWKTRLRDWSPADISVVVAGVAYSKEFKDRADLACGSTAVFT